MWVEFVGSLLCFEGFSPCSPVFLPPQKTWFDLGCAPWTDMSRMVAARGAILYAFDSATLSCVLRNRPFYSSVLTWPLDASEAEGDLTLIQTSLLFLFKWKLVSIRTTWSTQQNQWGLYQNKVTSSLDAIGRPGHWADNCKMVYSATKAASGDD